VLGFGLVWACLLALLALLLPVAARAEGKPDLGISVTSPKSILFGAKATVTLEASNPTGEPYGYNLSYRAVLPEGVAYVPGSTKIGSGGAAPTPTILENQPKTKETTLIWSNVGDLSPASHETLSFEVVPATATYAVASTFTVPAEAFVAEAPRYLPKFKANGEPKGPESTSFTGYAKGSAKTAISALEIKQEEGSPEGEILRGVHDHQTVYKVTVTNNKVNATTSVNVDDWLPASLEYLGCGGAGSDHTTDAPTNPGSAEEYPGSGPIEVAVLGGCTAPALVETIETDPDGAGVDPTAVYTHLRWTVTELKPGESRTFEFRAAVPLRENTTTWPAPAGEPSSASGEQAANLNNNSGAETRDGESIVTFAKTEGLYKSTTAVSAEEHLTRVAKDLTTEKSADLTTLSDGQVSKWTILVHSSEYRYNTKVEVTDTLPNGLCPLSSTNLTPSAECEPNKAPSSPYTSTKEEENGTWKLVWNETTDPALATLKQNETTTITFYSNTRTHYQSKHAQAGPILSNDKIENTVLANATTNVVCDNDTDCSEGGAKPIDHERPLSEPVQDNSHFTQTAEGPAIKKEVAASGTNCLGDTYTSAIPVYHPGDLVCWRLQASFPATLSTHGTEVTDFLPELVLFDEAFNAGKGEAPTSEDTLPATTFDHSEAPGTEPGGALKWTLPESGIVGNGSQRFERVFATGATLTKSTPLGDLQGNLMKFASINSAGESFALRAEADYKLQFPQLSLEKQIVKVNGTAFGPATSATVKGGSEVEFALTVKNAGEVEALNTEVRDLLPNGIACAEIVAGSITNKGSCTSGVISWGETGLGQEAIGVPALGQTVLHFSVKLSTALDPATTLEDKAGVREYHSATNTGGEYTYIPAENIDPLLTEKEANVPAANAHASVKTEEVTLTKTHTTSVNETGNKLNEATIGEEVTFEVTTTIPSGTTLSGFAKITDPGIPTTRLAYEAGSVEALVNGGAAPGTFKHEDIAGSPVVTLPENYAAPANEPVKVTMRFRTHVANVALNNAAGSAAEKAIPNKGKLAWTNPLSGAQTREASNEVPLVEPSITLTQTPSNGTKVHGGQLVEYSLKLKNAAGASTAFGEEIVDTVPNGLTPANAKGEALKNGEATASGGIWNEGARTIAWKLEKLEGGKEQAYAFFATVNEAPVAGTSLKNVAIATTASLPVGSSTMTRTAENAPTAAIKLRYEAEVKGTLEVEGATIVKESDSATATIGHRITYTLVVTLPAHVVTFDETVLDPLPASLDFDEYVSAKCTTGCPPEAEPAVLTYKPETPTPTSATTVGWYLGNLTETSVPRKITLVFRASVRAENRTTKAPIEATNKISNSATVYYNQSSKVPFEEAKIPATSLFASESASKAVVTEVLEPKLTLAKEASVNGGAYSATEATLTDGATVDYRLKVTNTGSSPAYGIVVADKPPSALEAVTPTENAGFVTSNVAGEIAWKIPGPIAAGASVQLGYSTKLVPVKGLKAGQAVDNHATVPAYFGVSESERLEGHTEYLGKAIPYREYKGPSVEVKATVALPAISIEKAALEGAKYQASANAEVGQPFTWRVIVKNTSKVAAKSVKVADKLPANWEYVAGSAEFSGGHKEVPTQSGSLEPGRELTWSTSIELAAGASTTLTYQAKPTLAAETNPGIGKAGVNSASATVLDAAENPEDASGPFGAGPATASGVLVVPVLEVTKVPSATKVAAGAEDAYTVRIHNSGAGIAREVKVLDTFPAGMLYTPGKATSAAAGFTELAATSSSATWQIATIAAAGTAEIKVPIGTEASLASGTKLTNEVAVHSVEAPTPVIAQGTIETTTSADLEAFKEVVSKGPYVPGEKLTYKIGATNKGPSVARAVKLTDELPSGETFQKASSANCKATGQLVTCEEAELAFEAKVAFEIEVELASSAKGAIVNSVLVKSETPDPEEKNNKASVTITPEPQADLKLEKTALVTPVVLGETASFELLVTNKGPSDAEAVQIVDHLPSGLVYESASGAEASCKAGGVEGREVTCTLPKAIAAGGQAAVVLVLETKALGTLLNKATVSSTAKDVKPIDNSSEANVLVVPAPALTKEAGGPAVTIGQRVKYTLTLTLPAHLTTYDHTVIDTLPDTLDFDEYSSAQCTAGCTAETTPTIHTYKAAREVSGTTRIAWDLGDVPASKAARTITLSYFASVRSTRYVAGGEVKAGEVLENTASDYYDQTNKQSFNENTIPAPGSFDRAGSPQSTSTPVVEPQLTLIKQASVNGGGFKAAPFTIAAGDTVIYRLLVKNTGTSPAYETAVRDTPPSGLAVTETVANPAATVTKAWSEGTPEIDWQIAGPLAVGETVMLEYKAELVVGSVKDGQKLTNTASVPSYFGASEAERGEGKENYFKEKILYRKYVGPSAQLIATVALPVLEVSKEAVKPTVAAGEEDSYTIVVKNTGTGVAHEVLAEDTLPTGMTYKVGSATAEPTTGFSEKSASATKVVWEVASIAAGAKVEITMHVGTEASLASGAKLTNKVAVQAPAAPTPVKAEGTITLTTSADLEASKEVIGKGPYVPGEPLTYRIGAKNNGPSVAQAVKLIDELPSGETFKKASSSKCKVVGQLVTCEEAEVAPEVEVAFEIEVELASSAEGVIVNTVFVKSETPDPNPNNNKDTKEVTVSPEANLALTKIAPETVITGEELTWTLNVENEGPSDATGVTAVDPLPAGTSYLKSTSSQGKVCEYTVGQVTCELEGLANKASATITITARVTAAPGSLTNTATVKGEQTDPHPENNEASATTTVLAPPSVSKASDSPIATIGHRIAYTLTVTIPAQATTFNQTVIDTLPDTLDFDEYVSATCTAGCTTPETTIAPQTYVPKIAGSTPEATSVAWYLGNLTAASTARTVVLVYRASVREAHRTAPHEKVQAPAEIENSAAMYYNQTNKGSFEEATIPSPESFDQKTQPVSTGSKVVEPKLTLTKEASVNGAPFSAAPFTITAADTVTYQLQVQNTGTSPAYSADVTDVIPAGLTVVSTGKNPAATVTKAWSEGSPEIAWQIPGPLEPGKPVTLEYHAKLNTTLVTDGQELTNIATVPSYFGVSEAERGEGKETYFREKIPYRTYTGPSAPLTATVALPVLTVTKTAVTPSVIAGETDSYTITVRNTGTSVAHEVQVLDTLPEGMTYEAGSAKASPATSFTEESIVGKLVTWKIATIGSGETVEINVPVGIEASVTAPELKNKVAVTSTEQTTPAEAEGTIKVTTSAELVASKSASPGSVAPGREVTYTIGVLNKGPSVARAVKLVDSLPVGTKFVSADAGCSNVAGTVECAVGELAPNASANYHVTVLVESSVTTPVVNTVEATSPTHDPEPANNKHSVTVDVTPEADLELLKIAPPSVITGEELTWTLTAKNNGPSDATHVTVVDPLPPGTSYLSSKPSQGKACVYIAPRLTCDLEGLVSGASATVAVTARVTAPPGSLTNTATVEGEQTDPELENNKASATTTVLEPPSIAKASDSPEATIGHRITYTLTVTVPAGVATFNQTAIDTLPETLDFDEYVSATCTSGCTTPETAIVVQTYKPDVLAGVPFTTSVAWYLGNLTAAPAARTVVLVYRASVREYRRGSPPSEAVRASEEIENSAALYFNQADKGSFEEATIPAPASFDQKSSPVSTSTMVVEPSLTLSKEASVNGGGFSAAPFTIEAADTVTYRLTVENTGSSPAYDADVSDVLPSGLTVLGTVANPAATETKAWSEADREIVWQIAGPLQAGEEIILEYSVKLNTALVEDGKPLTNTASVPSYYGVSEQEGGEHKKNFAGEDILYRKYTGPSAPLTATVALPVLEVTKTPAQPSVIAGDKDSYTIFVKNTGTSVAHEVQVLDTLPTGMTYQANTATAKPPTGFTEESIVGKVVTWKIAAIGGGETVEINVPVGIEASVETGSELKNKAAVTSTEQTTPVEAEGPIKVTTSADVEAKKSVLGGATTAVPGAELTYVVAAKNKGGPSVARAVHLIDKLPPGVAFVSAQTGCTQSAGTVTCEAGNLNPEQEVSFQIVVSVLSGYSGSIANTVRAESTATPGHPATPDPKPTNNEDSVEVSTLPSADLALVKTALTPEVHPGQQATFSLVVTNNGPSDAAEAKLIDTLPPGLAYESASGAPCEAAGQTVTCTLGTLTAKSSVTVTLTTQPAGLGSYTNTATVSSTTPDPDPGNNSSEATVEVVPVPVVTPVTPPTAAIPPASGVSPSIAAMARTRVTLRKLVREHEVAPGGRLDYRLIVRNAGAQTAEKLKVCDDLPEQTTVINPGGGHLAGARICFTLATLAAGRSHTFALVLRADSDAGAQIVNHATVTGRNFDPAHARASTPVPKASVSPARENHVTG